MKYTFSGHSVVVAAEEQVACDLADEVAILDLKSGVYFGLNTVAAYIWHLIQEPKTVTEVHEALVEEYDVEPERCQRDLVALLEELAAKGLIEVKDAADA